jgi:PKD repeat protein
VPSAPGATVPHDYLTDGAHKIKLTVSGRGGEDSFEVTVYQAAQAGFTADKISGLVGMEVTFTDTSTGDYNNLTWNFGDRTGTASGHRGDPPVAHSYQAKGRYEVTLTVGGGNGGTDIGPATPVVIQVYNPVTVAFSASPLIGPAPLSVDFADQSAGDYDSVTWNYGDQTPQETTTSKSGVRHEFKHPGVFNVTLTIFDKDTVPQAHTLTKTVTVYEKAQAKFTTDPLPPQGPYPLNMTFTDQSTGERARAVWDFGDDSPKDTREPPALTVPHKYERKGDYTVTLTVTGKGGDITEAKTLVSVYTPVTAGFSAPRAQLLGVAPHTVQFKNESTGDYDTFAWDFNGDDVVDSTSPNPTFLYTEPTAASDATVKQYTVSLTVSGNGGEATETKVDYVTVYAPVKADFDASPPTGKVPLTVRFTNKSKGAYDSFAWDFDDDGRVDSRDRDPVYTYTRPGLYTVSLTASGKGGTDKKMAAKLINAYTIVLEVDPMTVTVESWAVNGYPISVRNAGTGPQDVFEWKATVVTGAEWLTITPTTEVTGDGEFLLNYQENLSLNPRTATISVEAPDAEGSPATVSVVQQGKGAAQAPILSVTPESRSVDSSLGSTTFRVENTGGGTMEWIAYVREGSDWLSIVSGSSGTNASTIEASYLANTTRQPRTAVVRVRVTNPDIGFVDVSVTQASAPARPVLAVTPSHQDVELGATTVSFAVTNADSGTLHWTASVTAGDDWLTILSGSEGANAGTIEVSVAKNLSANRRTGTIRVMSSDPEDSPVDVTITQKGNPLGCQGGSPEQAGGSFSGDALLIALAATALLAAGRRVPVVGAGRK